MNIGHTLGGSQDEVYPSEGEVKGWPGSSNWILTRKQGNLDQWLDGKRGGGGSPIFMTDALSSALQKFSNPRKQHNKTSAKNRSLIYYRRTQHQNVIKPNSSNSWHSDWLLAHINDMERECQYSTVSFKWLTQCLIPPNLPIFNIFFPHRDGVWSGL